MLCWKGLNGLIEVVMKLLFNALRFKALVACVWDFLEFAEKIVCFKSSFGNVLLQKVRSEKVLLQCAFSIKYFCFKSAFRKIMLQKDVFSEKSILLLSQIILKSSMFF